jgi:uncharacterized Zn finger protein (UPF0148 family)
MRHDGRTRCPSCDRYFPWTGWNSWVHHQIAEHPDSPETAEIRRMIDRRAESIARQLQGLSNEEAP